jgi:hypothetical protein
MALSLLWLAPAWSMVGERLSFSSSVVADGFRTIRAEGTIGREDGTRLRLLLEEVSPRSAVVILSSGGGRLRDAVEMAEAVVARQATVVVPPGGVCAAVCALVLLSAPDRAADPSARIGLHDLVTYAWREPDMLSLAARVSRLLAASGVPLAIAQTIDDTPSRHLRWLTPAEAAGAGIRLVRLPLTVAAPGAIRTFWPHHAVAEGRAAWQWSRSDGVRVDMQEIAPARPAAGFYEGILARIQHEEWRASLHGAAREGMLAWEGWRGGADPCRPLAGAAESACHEARRRTEALGRRRRVAGFLDGWHAFVPSSLLPDIQHTILRWTDGMEDHRRWPALTAGFLTVPDIDGDGVEDVVLDYRRILQGGRGPVQVFLSRPDGFRMVFYNNTGVLESPAGFRLRVAAPNCRASECGSVWRLEGNVFVFAGDAEPEPRR